MIDYDLLFDLIQYNKYRKSCFNNYTLPIVDDRLLKILNARYQKISRIRKKFLYLYLHSKNIYFCTFTFNDFYLSHCDRSKKDLVKASLLSFDSNILIIMNKDFGKKTEREHYHCIVGTNLDEDIIKGISYPYRFNVERVSFDNNSFKCLSKYIDKLANHCIKDSTKKSRIYYNYKGFVSFSSFDYRQTLSLLRLT